MLSSIAAGALSFNVAPRVPVVSMGLQAGLAAEFVYGTPAAASGGLPGFSNPTSFVSGTVVPTGRASAVTVAPIGNEFCYGAPKAASSGLPGFSNPTSFNTGALAPAAAPAGAAAKVAPIGNEFCYGAPKAASKGLPGFANACSFEASP